VFVAELELLQKRLRVEHVDLEPAITVAREEDNGSECEVRLNRPYNARDAKTSTMGVNMIDLLTDNRCFFLPLKSEHLAIYS
jgi:hypothetical protein